MNPTDNQPDTGSYLDQIAPKSTKSSILSNRKPALLFSILGVLALITLLLMVFVQLTKGSTDTTEQLAAKLTSIKSTVDESTNKLKNSKIRAVNSELKLYLTNTLRDFGPILEKENIDIKKMDPKVLKSESNERLLETLEDARLNAVFDRTYAREMSYQLELALNLMTKIEKNSKTAELKSFVQNAKTNLAPIQEEFELFSAN